MQKLVMVAGMIKASFPIVLKFETHQEGNMRGISVALLFLFTVFSVPLFAAEMVAINKPLPKTLGEQSVLTLVVDSQKYPVTLAELENMPMYQASLKTYWGMSGVFQGVRMSDFLARFKIGKNTKHLVFHALDNYTSALSFGEFSKSSAMLATRLNGQPIALTNKGPFILLWPEKAESALNGTSTLSSWIWSISEIDAQ